MVHTDLLMKRLAVLMLCLFVCRTATAQQSKENREARHFTLKVLPVLKDKCFGCHGADSNDIKGDYDVTSRDSTLQGGESEEAAIIPGDAERGNGRSVLSK